MGSLRMCPSNQTNNPHNQAVAVVVSLRDARKRVGVFRLTEPDGMQLIQQYVAWIIKRNRIGGRMSVISMPPASPKNSISRQSNTYNADAPSAASIPIRSPTTLSTRTIIAWCGRTRASESWTSGDVCLVSHVCTYVYVLLKKCWTG